MTQNLNKTVNKEHRLALHELNLGCGKRICAHCTVRMKVIDNKFFNDCTIGRNFYAWIKKNLFLSMHNELKGFFLKKEILSLSHAFEISGRGYFFEVEEEVERRNILRIILYPFQFSHSLFLCYFE